MGTQKLILDKLTEVLSATDKLQTNKFKAILDGAKCIFVGGAGRSGLVSGLFSMRLVHCGYKVESIGGTVTHASGPGDVLVIVSSSGATRTLIPILEIAKASKTKIVLVSKSSSSPMAELSDLVIRIGNEDLFGKVRGMPMGTVFELATLIYLESVIAEIIFDKNLDEAEMRKIHANLE